MLDEIQQLADTKCRPSSIRWRKFGGPLIIDKYYTVSSIKTRNQLFVKKQQMRWTQRGAHLLLQTRVQVLNEDLRNTFCRWFPGMKADQQVELKAA